MTSHSAEHAHAFVWQEGRYVCPCGVWCHDLPPITPPGSPTDSEAS